TTGLEAARRFQDMIGRDGQPVASRRTRQVRTDATGEAPAVSEPATGPLVTDEIRSCIGVATAPGPLVLERERLPLILTDLGLTRIQFRPPESPDAFRAARGVRRDTVEASSEPAPFPERRERWFEDVRAGDELGPLVRVATPATIEAFLPRSARGRVTQSNSN